ncbi:MAG: peptidoglycan editing factor PgeF [Oscillospiraceae bacterium]|nr:peptidoglycan editing factor PgeF [Oscillospiraceae bacterium]
MENRKIGALELIADPNIPVPHGFTTRMGGVSTGIFSSLNLGMHRGDDSKNVAENYRILCQALGFSEENLVLTHQIHSDLVRVVDRTDAGKGFDHRAYPQCDALVTNTPGVALMVFTADCTPVLLYDRVTGAVGAAHAGWRGTASGIVSKTVEAMVTNFGSKPQDLVAAIGPNIGACCFETDTDVPEAILSALGDTAAPYITRKGEKFHLDLKAINGLWLYRAGVQTVTLSDYCTACSPHRFWSHRVTNGQRGSQGAVILCKEIQL